MTDIAIFYGTNTGATRRIAERLKIEFGAPYPDVISVISAKASDMERYPFLILATPTWGIGDLDDQWESFLPELDKANLSGHTVAIVGLGDQRGHPESFADAMGLVYHKVTQTGARVIGRWPTWGYHFTDSLAVDGDQFVGLALDEESQADETGPRIVRWVAQIKEEFARDARVPKNDRDHSSGSKSPSMSRRGL